MQFNSITFLIFMLVAATAYYLLPHKLRNIFLLLASYFFYFWSMPQYGVFLVFSTTVSYFAARKFVLAPNSGKKSKRGVVLSVSINLAVLIFFKYFGFFADALATVGLVQADAIPALAMPIGISFYTFMLVGYNVDVYRGSIMPERNFLTFALFSGFFPAIVAGPIGRAGELLPQYKEKHEFNYSNIVEGLQRFLVGAMKKVVIADGMGIIVNNVYRHEQLRDYTGLILLFAVVLYALQIYFDFSGYSDMAVGVAKILGFTLRENFRAPYLSSSMSELWTRWHISLTSWFRDYIYIPLGGNRKGFSKKVFNIITVFVISGLWHGSTINFLLWGLLHALYGVVEEFIYRAKKSRPKKEAKSDGFILRNLKRAGVFSLWALALIFFRAETVSDAVYVIINIPRLFSVGTALSQVMKFAATGIGGTGIYYLSYFGLIALSLFIATVFDRKVYAKDASINVIASYKKRTRWILYWIMGISVMVFYFILLTISGGTASFAYAGF